MRVLLWQETLTFTALSSPIWLKLSLSCAPLSSLLKFRGFRYSRCDISIKGSKWSDLGHLVSQRIFSECVCCPSYFSMVLFDLCVCTFIRSFSFLCTSLLQHSKISRDCCVHTYSLQSRSLFVIHFFLCYWLMIHVICLQLTTDTMKYIVGGNMRLITGESPWLSSHHTGMMVRKFEDPIG